MQNILITGAAGFIGSTFATTLSKLQNVNLNLIDSLDFGTIENLPIELR
jgi:UDP-glucose 4-epimerase